MSNRHLPAGQNILGGAGGMPGVDMGNGPGGGHRGRRQQPHQYVPQYHHHQHHQQQPQQHMNPMYQYNMPYAPQAGYYGMPPQFQNGAMPSPGYMPYQNYARSPPSMHQYVPMVGVSVPPNYHIPAQQSPNLSTPYQPPPVSAPVPPLTPSSTHSSQLPPPPTPPTPQPREQVSAPPSQPEPESSPPVVERQPFHPPLPWLSRPDAEFPVRSARSRRRRKPLNADSKAVSLPVEQHEAVAEQSTQEAKVSAPAATQTSAAPAKATPTAATPSTQPAVTQKPVEGTASTASRSIPNGSAAPVTPVLPRPASKQSNPEKSQVDDKQAQENDAEVTAQDGAPTEATVETEDANGADAASPPVRAPPSSWAKLFTPPSAKAHAGPNASPTTGAPVNGNGATAASNVPGSSVPKSNAVSLAEAIQAYRVDSIDRLSFLEPRGLINTGNMCYMNSVLQVLMFCVPFYDFLDQVGKRAAHSFKSETPLIDAMIMFMHEYKAIKSGSSVDELRRSLSHEDFERHGEPFTPEFVYEAIRQLSRFASMRRGHQQDAEEFLGFLLQSLDDECTHVVNALPSNGSDGPYEDGAGDGSSNPTGDWLEVGRKQRAAVSRLSGSSSSTPITKIFGGLLRSEFRVPGLKDSITTEPYQPLQLDIGSPDVRNVVDALRGLTRPERMQGDFNSPRGKDVTATKQVFIETLPPVLILHLKRFQFDAEGNGTVKIWKKIGYPLELEIPLEVLSRQKRQTMGDGGLPKYKLISVVYHHGKNASGGHYTADVRRQEGREWIRLDDTVIRRMGSEDVADVGSQEEPRDIHKEQSPARISANRFDAMNDEDTGDEDGWKEVTTSAGGNKRWSSVANGTPNGHAKEKQVKDNVKDNKVAYLLFYQRV